jgi:hypothetical protein
MICTSGISLSFMIQCGSNGSQIGVLLLSETLIHGMYWIDASVLSTTMLKSVRHVFVGGSIICKRSRIGHVIRTTERSMTCFCDEMQNLEFCIPRL